MCLGVMGVVIVLFAGMSAFFWLYDNWWNKPEADRPPSMTAWLGDSVEIEYTAFFMEDPSGPFGTETVFETTMRSVAKNDSYPKSLTFDILHDDTSTQFSSRTVTLGEAMITQGMDDGVIGMKKNEKKTFTVAPDEAYGRTDEELVYRLKRQQEVSVYEFLNFSMFETFYPEELEPDIGTTLSHHFWKWPVRILMMDNDTVILENTPAYGEVYTPLSWPVTVKDISSSLDRILVVHDTITANGQVVLREDFEPYDPEFIQTVEYPGIVSVFADEIHIDFNFEAVGKNVRYEVTVIKIER